MEQLTAAVCAHGEGPVWDAAGARLLWLDMPAGAVWARDDAGDTTRTIVDEYVAALRPRRDGGWVVATARDFVLTDTDFRSESRIPVITSDTEQMNDGGCLSDGSFLCGSQGPSGELYRLDPSGSVTTVLTGVEISNGLAEAPDGFVFYVDSVTKRIDRLTFDATGGLASRTVFADLADEVGLPDGIALDTDGGVWVAMWGQSEVLRVGPDGTVSDRHAVLATNPTACAFGGPELDELFITSSTQDLHAPGPADGALFRLRPGRRGTAPLPYAG